MRGLWIFVFLISILIVSNFSFSDNISINDIEINSSLFFVNDTVVIKAKEPKTAFIKFGNKTFNLEFKYINKTYIAEFVPREVGIYEIIIDNSTLNLTVDSYLVKAEFANSTIIGNISYFYVAPEFVEYSILPLNTTGKILIKNSSFKKPLNLSTGNYTVLIRCGNCELALNLTMDNLNSKLNISDVKEIEFNGLRFNVSTNKGKFENLSFDGENITLIISNLSRFDKVNVTVGLPFKIPEGLHIYYWKEVNNSIILVNYTVSKDRRHVTFELQDGIIDEDGKPDGRILDPLKLYIPRFDVKSQIYGRFGVLNITLRNESYQIKVEVSKGNLSYLKAVDAENLPNVPKGFRYPLIKFRIENISRGDEVEVKITYPKIDGSLVEFFKFNPYKIEDYSFLAKVENSTITLKLKDGGFLDDDGSANGVIEDDGGWLSSWKYRLPITINNPNSQNLTNFQVKIKIDSSQNHFWDNVDSRAKDVRFIDADGQMLNYWIESWNYSSKNAIIWVKVNLTANSNKTIYLYYGNPLALGIGWHTNPDGEGWFAGDGDKVFEFFDDFETDPNTDGKWIIYRNENDLSSEGYWDSNTKVWYLTKAVGSRGIMAFFNKTLNYPFVVDFRYKIGGGTGADGLAFAFDKDITPYKNSNRCGDGGSLALTAVDGGSDGYAVELDNWDNGDNDPSGRYIAVARTNGWNGGYPRINNNYYNTDAVEDNQWHRIEAKINSTEVVYVKLDNSTILSNIPITPLNYSRGGLSAATGGATNNHIVDYIFIRKYASIEPIVEINSYQSLQIKGTIYEDVDGDADITDDGVGIANVTVKLYKDDGDNQPDNGDSFISQTLTDANGNYLFQLNDTGVYWVVVDSKTIKPSAGYNDNYNLSFVWAEQTYGSRGVLWDDDANSSTPPIVRSTNGEAYGGRYGDKSDDATSLATAEHVAKVVINSTNRVVDVDFGFSFNVVVNTRDADDDLSSNRTAQGSLRQFIINANAIKGANYMRFVPMVQPNIYDSSGKWWKITLNEPLPAIKDNNTVIDGTAYYPNGTIRDENHGNITFNIPIGLGDDGIPNSGDETTLTFKKLELEIDGNDLNGITISADNVVVKGIAIYNIGSVYAAGFEIENGTKNFTIRDCLIGVRANGSEPVDDKKLYGYGIKVWDGDINTTGRIEHNLIAYTGNCGIGLGKSSTTSDDVVKVEVVRNAIINIGIDGISSYVDGIAVYSDYAIIKENLIANISMTNTLRTSGKGIEVRYNSDNTAIINNTIINCESSAIMFDDDSDNAQVIGNYITSCYAGVVVGRYYGSSVNIIISKNAIYSNKNLGIDLDFSDNKAYSGDNITINDGLISSYQPNYGIDYPIITSAYYNGTHLYVEGYIGKDGGSETFANAVVDVYLVKNSTDGDNLIGNNVSSDGLVLNDSYGEGWIYLGSLIANNSGYFRGYIYIANKGVTDNAIITATATINGFGTSEFGKNYVLKRFNITATIIMMPEGYSISVVSLTDMDDVYVYWYKPDNIEVINISGDFSIYNKTNNLYWFKFDTIKANETKHITIKTNGIAVNGLIVGIDPKG